MPVGADDTGDRITDRHAVAHLRDRRIIVLAENLQRAVLILLRLRLERDIGGNGLSVPRKLLLARGIAKQAPGRHRPLAGPVDLRIGVEPGLDGQSPGALLVGIGSHLTLLHCNTLLRRPFRTSEMSCVSRDTGRLGLQAGRNYKVKLATKGTPRIIPCRDGRGRPAAALRW
jgi:hypothetical protein